jgi:quercetin dioxygenase-like cupin family protein
MKVTSGHEGRDSEERGATFTGTVWADAVLAEEGAPTVNSIFFRPAARTHWHSHELGQLLFVTSGSGHAQVREGEGREITAGDVVWFPPGEVHWHGARPGTFMSHTAVSLGTTDWLDPVSEEEYHAVVG